MKVTWIFSPGELEWLKMLDVEPKKEDALTTLNELRKRLEDEDTSTKS